MRRSSLIAILSICLCALALPVRPLAAQEPDTAGRYGFGNRDRLAPQLKMCGKADSLIYGDIRTSPEDGDASGLEFVFDIRTDSIRGHVRKAAGGVGMPLALHDLQYDVGRDSLSFWYNTATRSFYYLTVRLGCRRMAGSVRRVTAASRSDDISGADTIAISLPRLRKTFP